MAYETDTYLITVRGNSGLKQKWCNWFKKFEITIEPIVLLFCFVAAFTESVITNMVETRVCTQKFNYSSEVCSNPMSESLEWQVQPFASRILMSKTLIDAFIPAIMAFFIGPWSDTNGRKPFLLASIAGYVICYALWGVFAYFKTIPASYFLLVTIPTSLTGGYVALFTCVFCYISDVTTANNRSFRMVFIQLSVLLGFLVGSLLVPFVYKIPGGNADSTVFLIACGCCSVIFFYTLLFLPETVNNSRELQKSLFDVSHLKDMMQIVLKQRPNKGRAAVLMSLVICTISVAIYQGDMSVRYLSLRAMFSWTLEEFTDFSAICSSISAICSLVGMWFFCKILGLREIYFAFGISVLGLISEILVSCSRNSFSYKLSVNIACLSILMGPITRSEVSKIVSKSDLGKAFAFLSCLEALTPLITPPLYIMVYNLVLKSFPLAVFFLSALLWIVNLLLVMFLIVIHSFYGSPYTNEEFIEEASHSEEDSVQINV